MPNAGHPNAAGIRHYLIFQCRRQCRGIGMYNQYIHLSLQYEAQCLYCVSAQPLILFVKNIQLEPGQDYFTRKLRYFKETLSRKCLLKYRNVTVQGKKIYVVSITVYTPVYSPRLLLHILCMLCNVEPISPNAPPNTNHKHPKIWHFVEFLNLFHFMIYFSLIFHISGTNEPILKIQKAIQLTF